MQGNTDGETESQGWEHHDTGSVESTADSQRFGEKCATSNLTVGPDSFKAVCKQEDDHQRLRLVTKPKQWLRKCSVILGPPSNLDCFFFPSRNKLVKLKQLVVGLLCGCVNGTEDLLWNKFAGRAKKGR